ncbi:MAG: EAL domain-containing protein [Candidatus Thiodiazotropha sp. 6PDIVS]
MSKRRPPLTALYLILLLTISIDLQEWVVLADSATPATHSSHLIAAIPSSFPPQYAIDDQGKPYGFAIDIMNAVAEEAGLTMEYRVYESWQEVHQAIKEGQVQLIPNMGITPDRQTYVNFTSPVETFSVSLFVRAETESLNSIQDLAGHQVGVIKGNVAIKLLQDKQLNLKQYNQLSEALIELLSGQIDALAYPDPTVWRYTQHLGLDDHIRKLQPSLIEIKRAIAVVKGEFDLLKRLNQALNSVIQSDRFENIYSQWYATPAPYWNTLRTITAMSVVVMLVAMGMLLWRYRSLQKLYHRLTSETEMRREAEHQLQRLNADLKETVRRQTEDLAEAQRMGKMGSWVLDLQQNSLEWSDETFRIFEIDPKQFDATYEKFLETVHPDDRERVSNTYMSSLEDKEFYEIEHRLLLTDGRVKWVKELCETQFDRHGHPVISRGTVQDITERKASERQLTLTQYALDHISEAAYLMTPDGHFKYVNNAACEALGYSCEELIKKSVMDIDPSITPEKFAEVDQKLKDMGSLRFETKHQHRDGHAIPVEIVANPIFFEDDVFSFAVVRDISDIKSAQREIQQQHALLQQVIDGVSDPILMIDTNYNVQLMNRAAKSAAPVDVIEAEKPKCYAISHHRDQPCLGNDHPCPLQEVMKTHKTVKVVHNHPGQDEEVSTYELLANPLFDEQGNITGIIESGRDITDYLSVADQLRKNQSRLDHIAHHDPLTGMPNRLLFVDRLQQAIFKAKRSGTMVALLFIDLDRFKQINDSFGHPTGDLILKEAAIRLKSMIREEDTIARIGGDKFTVILNEIVQTQNIVKIAEKLLSAFTQGFQILDKELFLSSSIGISIYPQDSDEPNTLIRNADSAMYKAKEMGRNAYSFYTSEMTDMAFERLMMENSLRKAVKLDQLVLHYQPQIDIRTGRVVGVEALVRWQHPELGLLPPAKFIPLAEESGLIQPIGEWILHQACKQAHKWCGKGFTPERISVNCNLSASQLNSERFIERILNVLEETSIDADLLELEITETTIMNNPEHMSDVLNRLRDIGIKLAIDDFGTGYSSLSYLKALPISKLKIDQSFVRDIPSDQDDMAITRAIIALGESLQMQVIAEGVETKAQAKFLYDEGCFLAQGFLYAKPMGSDDLDRYLELIHLDT